VGEGFRLTLNRGSESERILRLLLVEKGLIKNEETKAGIPDVAFFDFDPSSNPDLFPIGVGIDGPVTLDPRRDPHHLIVGSAGSGKSVIQRNILHHCLTHNDKWKVYGIDLGHCELSYFKRLKNTVSEVATTVPETLTMLEEILEEMWRRYGMLETAGMNHLLDLDSSNTEYGDTRGIFILIDEAMQLFHSDQKPEHVEDLKKCREIITKIAELGRAVKMHLSVSTQRVDPALSTILYNFNVRISCGRLSRESYSILFNSEIDDQVIGNRGSGFIQVKDERQAFQAYFSSPSSGTEWVLNQGRAAEPELFKRLTELT
jgi:S-DNA-T family DNA segregation ATPase FtsK/SpoIIIE